MERPKIPALCCLAAGLLLLALVTDGFSFEHEPETRWLVFGCKLIAVRLACALLTATGLALCRAETGRQTVQIYGLALVITLALCAWELAAAYAAPAEQTLQVDFSQFLPSFVLILMGSEVICQTGTLCALLDLAALGLSTLLWVSPEWLFGWGVSACFFDILCVASTLFLLPAVDALRRMLERMPRDVNRRSPKRPQK